MSEGKAMKGKRLVNCLCRVRLNGFMLLGALGACASTPGDTGPISEKLDPDTATTVTILSRPIELLAQGSREGVNDPFAYLAPFETDKMGQRELFLWVATPKVPGAPQQPQVLCNGQPLSLQPISADKIDLSQLSLSRAPYDAPVPWSSQWYFRLPEEGLKCLADASGIVVQAQSADGTQREFSTIGRKSLASLDAFTRR
jgi:hypothetical protein